MTTTCPHGHESSSDDWCDVCGTRIGAPPAERPAPSTSAPSAATTPCPVCDTMRTASDPFCEACGYDFVSGAALTPAAPAVVVATWRVAAIADHDHYERVAPEGVDFPRDYVERTFPLTADVVTVGRRSASAGVQPDIDLADPPLDPGISHRHARFERAPDGSYSVVDTNSTNGTTVNGGTAPVAPGIPVRLVSGDRVHVGAWTTLVVTAEEESP